MTTTRVTMTLMILMTVSILTITVKGQITLRTASTTTIRVYNDYNDPNYQVIRHIKVEGLNFKGQFNPWINYLTNMICLRIRGQGLQK
jgi:hypothetical protein